MTTPGTLAVLCKADLRMSVESAFVPVRAYLAYLPPERQVRVRPIMAFSIRQQGED